MMMLLGASAVLAAAIAMLVAVRLVRTPLPVGYALVPAKDFDPSMEEVRRFGAGLVEARAAVGRGTKTRQMVRLAIVSNPQGDLVTLVSSSPRARSVLERVGYFGCALEAVDEVMGDHHPTWLAPPVVAPPERTPPRITPTVESRSPEPEARSEKRLGGDPPLVGRPPESNDARRVGRLIT